MSFDSHDYFIDDELYFENFESKYKKVFDVEPNYDVMSDDTINAIYGLMSTKINSDTLDLSGLLLEGTLDINNLVINIIIQANKIKKLDCSNNYFDTIIATNPNIVIEEFDFSNNPVKKIYFPCSFNKNIDFLPCTIKVLIFPPNSRFNNPINDLPTSLEILSTGGSFNHTINNLPKNLIHLMLGQKFNTPINKLPPNLRTLIFDELNEYKHNLNCLPNSLECISIPINFDSIEITIPDECKYICFNSNKASINYCQKLKENLKTKCYNSIVVPSNLKIHKQIYYK